MDKMLALPGNNLFLHKLPTQVLAALANTTITDCRALAEEADKIFLVGFHSVETIHLGLDYACMPADQTSDQEVQELRSATTGLQLEDVAFNRTSTTLLCGTTGHKTITETSCS